MTSSRSSSRGRPDGLSLWVILLALVVLAGCATPSPLHSLADVNHPGPLDEMPLVDLPAVEQRVLELVNEERTRRRLPPLVLESKLRDLARIHSVDMAGRRFFDHINPDGIGPTQRGESRGISCVRPAGEDRVAVGIGENIFSTYLFSSFTTRVVDGAATHNYDWKSVDALAREAVAGWMNSRGHRLNLLSRHYATIGIGAARDNEGQLFLTQNFC